MNLKDFFPLSLVLYTLGFLGASGTSLSSLTAQPRPPLVVEGTLRYQVNKADIVIPATLQGHAVTLVVGFGIDADVALDPAALASLGIPLVNTTHLAALTLGRSVVHDLALQIVPPVPVQATSGLPPVVGLVGNVFLARYDIVYDGPAQRVRFYDRVARPAPVSTASTPATDRPRPWLPATIGTASCTPMTPLPGHNTGFVIQANGHPISALLETLSSYTKMNMVAAKSIGLTQHSPNVHPLPDDIWEKQDAYGHPVKYQATDIHLTLGTQHFTEVPMLLFPGLDLDQYQTPIPPLLLLNPDDLQHQILVFSHSTGQVCIGVP